MTAQKVNLTDSDFVSGGPPPIKISKTTLEESTVFPRTRDQLINALKYLAELGDDWNGHGAEAPSTATLQSAETFFCAYPWIHHAAPDIISPGMDRSIILKWKLDANNVLSMTIDGLDISLSRLGQNDRIEDIPETEIKFLPGSFFPEAIKKHLPLRRS